MTDIVRKSLAELLGTFILVFFGVGSAVFGIDKVGALGVALAFGLVLLALAYAIGPVSGCHVNPAVTLGVLLRKGVTPVEAVAYWGAQFVGGVVRCARNCW
jgi:aquaporin Z